VSAPDPVPALAGLLVPRAAGGDAVRLSEIQADLVMVSARRSQETRFEAMLQAHLGLGLPSAGRATKAGGYAALSIGPGSPLIQGSRESLVSFRKDVSRDVAAVVDQSSGLTVLRLGGPRSPALLAKGCRLDLHPSAFAPGHCARTLIAQTTAILHQIDAVPTYDIIVPRTLARSFAEFLLHAAQAGGIEMSVSLKPEES
jgi:sarcosine oxidase subunit gamma